MLTYHFQQTNSILPADFYVIYWKFHPTRLLKSTRLLESEARVLSGKVII